MVIDETELEGLTEDQRDAYIALKEGRNVFLSGNAGTGKSYVLNRFIDDLEARSVPYTAMNFLKAIAGQAGSAPGAQ